jgi:hypothetical protein
MRGAFQFPRRRRGTTIIEAIGAMLLLSVATVTLTQLVALAARQSRQADERRIASQELANWMERAAAVPVDELTEKRLTEIQPAVDRLERLREPTFSAQVTDEEGPLAARRVELTMGWTNGMGGAAEELRLVAWRHELGEESP